MSSVRTAILITTAALAAALLAAGVYMAVAVPQPHARESAFADAPHQFTYLDVEKSRLPHDKFVNGSAMLWYRPPALNDGLPSSIKVWASNSSITPGVPLRSVYASINLRDPSLRFQAVSGTPQAPRKTPQQFAEESPTRAYAVINGGFFNTKTGESVSLIVHDSELIHAGQQKRGDYYVTLGAFAYYANRTTQSVWTYNPNSSFTYQYDQPAENSDTRPPLPEPNGTWPQGAQPLTATEAIGAGPLLLRNGVYYNGTEELWDDNILYVRHPRSAICRTRDDHVVLLAVDGRQSFSGGVALDELTAIMVQIGCVDAINLDGGGSTCLFANGQIANSPSDATGPRPVSTAVMITQEDIL